MCKIKSAELKHACGFSERRIAHSCTIGKSAVADYLRRARESRTELASARQLTTRP
jgi:transposase